MSSQQLAAVMGLIRKMPEQRLGFCIQETQGALSLPIAANFTSNTDALTYLKNTSFSA